MLILDGKKYCLKDGGVYNSETDEWNALYYEENIETLYESFGEENCSVSSNYVNCSVSGLRAYASDIGRVSAYASGWSCHVYSDGNAHCYE